MTAITVDTALEITFEVAQTPQTFAHVRSLSGILGRAAEVRARIPVGTWITVPEDLQPTVTTYLCDRCGFRYMGCLVKGVELEDVLVKESM